MTTKATEAIWITEADLSRELGLSTYLVRQMVERGQLPRPTQISKKFRAFRRAEVREFLSPPSTPSAPEASHE